MSLTKMIVFYRLNRFVWITTLIMLLCSLFVLSAEASSDTLKLTLICSGNEQGLFRARGCDQQIGGLDRRHTLIKSLCKNAKMSLRDAQGRALICTQVILLTNLIRTMN
ncbi:TPA: hypothetical protein EYP66_22255 [Candidatus Poribacteria bacterium]|nr:hypothetical protein [Candidatus Poribacteria bacterium]